MNSANPSGTTAPGMTNGCVARSLTHSLTHSRTSRPHKRPRIAARSAIPQPRQPHQLANARATAAQSNAVPTIQYSEQLLRIIEEFTCKPTSKSAVGKRTAGQKEEDPYIHKPAFLAFHNPIPKYPVSIDLVMDVKPGCHGYLVLTTICTMGRYVLLHP
ncbi:hypothetical protein M3J09_012251 [Ascochyta lentis]